MIESLRQCLVSARYSQKVCAFPTLSKTVHSFSFEENGNRPNELAPFGIDAAIIEPGTYPTAISAKRQVAADTERATLYQTAIAEFTTPFYAENRSATPPNPQEVADAVASVIAQPAGERPLRTVVATAAQRQAPQAVNDAVTQASRSFRETLAIPLVTIAPKSEKKE